MNTYNYIIEAARKLLKEAGTQGEESNSECLKSSFVENEAGFIQFQNPAKKELVLKFTVEREIIIFSFTLEGKISISTSLDSNILLQDPVKYFVLSYPYQNWEINFSMKNGTKVLLLCVPIKKLHDYIQIKLGGNGAGLDEIVKSYKLKRFFSTRKVTPVITVTLHQIFNNNIKEPYQKLYHTSKIMEFITHYLNGTEEIEKVELECPFLSSNGEVEKIKNARKIVLENMADPPGLTELAKAVGTNEYKLKVGFKKLFGNTVYGYLNDHRMEMARKMLEMEDRPVKDIAYQVGYSNTSHFIAAFKKKFGVTPKKYLKGIQA